MSSKLRWSYLTLIVLIDPYYKAYFKTSVLNMVPQRYPISVLTTVFLRPNCTYRTRSLRYLFHFFPDLSLQLDLHDLSPLAYFVPHTQVFLLAILKHISRRWFLEMSFFISHSSWLALVSVLRCVRSALSFLGDAWSFAFTWHSLLIK